MLPYLTGTRSSYCIDGRLLAVTLLLSCWRMLKGGLLTVDPHFGFITLPSMLAPAERVEVRWKAARAADVVLFRAVQSIVPPCSRCVLPYNTVVMLV